MHGMTGLLENARQGVNPLPLHVPLVWARDEESLMNNPLLRPQGDRGASMNLLVKALSLFEFNDALHGVRA
jgi:hypothetical protein